MDCSNTDAIGIGVVGVGSVALQGLLPHLTQDDIAAQATVTAVCDPAPGRAAAAAAKFGVPRAYRDYEALLADPAVDAVTIASPIALHHEQGRMAIEADRHVHFNKTMALTAAEATQLIDLAAERQVRIVASPGEMLRPYNRRVKELIEEGAIGRLCWAACGAAFGDYHENEPVRGGDDVLSQVDPSWYYRSPGGGPLYDMTVYALHALTGILGPARAVTALSGQRILERSVGNETIRTEVDDNSLLLLDFGNGLYAFAYGTAAGALNSWDDFSGRYYGTDGKIEGLLLDGEPYDYPGRSSAIAHADRGTRPGRGGNEWLFPHVTGVHREIPEQHVYEDVMQLVDWVRDDVPSIVSAEHARHVIEVIDAGYRAARSGQTQNLTTTF